MKKVALFLLSVCIMSCSVPTGMEDKSGPYIEGPVVGKEYYPTITTYDWENRQVVDLEDFVLVVSSTNGSRTGTIRMYVTDTVYERTAIGDTVTIQNEEGAILEDLNNYYIITPTE